MGRLIVPLTKSPHSGRIGPKEKQEWYQGLVLAQKLYEQGDLILVISDVQVAGEEHEANIYKNALESLGVSWINTHIVRQCQETTGQIEEASNIAFRRDLELVFISTWTHYLRVRWICFWDKVRAKHVIAWGRPRPKEAVTDFILTFFFPILDICRQRRRFLKWVETRRKSGKH
jgi:hypothetical protein